MARVSRFLGVDSVTDVVSEFVEALVTNFFLNMPCTSLKK